MSLLYFHIIIYKNSLKGLFRVDLVGLKVQENAQISVSWWDTQYAKNSLKELKLKCKKKTVNNYKGMAYAEATNELKILLEHCEKPRQHISNTFAI